MLDASEIFGRQDLGPATQPIRQFQAYDGGTRYAFTILPPGIAFDFDRLRRDRNQQLHGELAVMCDLKSAKTFNSVISVADFNASSASARVERARILTERAGADIDWFGLLEEFCQRLLVAERLGQPAPLLSAIPRRAEAETLHVEHTWAVLRRHPVILFGDGSSGKSYVALYAAGRLAQAGEKVLYCDWELAGDTQRARFERLFGGLDMPDVHYARCDRPLVVEVDRLRRLVQDHGITYVVFDSVAFACLGPPESAETASAYFGALRQMGEIGSLHIAHVSKAEGGEYKPFGSAFWHNGARMTWYVSADELPIGGGARLRITLTPRKSNLAERPAPITAQLRFIPGATEVSWIPYAPPDPSDSNPVNAGKSAKARRS